MNLFDKIKMFFSKNGIRQLSEPTKEKMETNRKPEFLQNLKIKDDPFSNLLSEENMKRINIDKELQPLFKDEIGRIRDYFIKNDLMSVKNFDKFFKKHLLDGKLEIKISNEDEMPDHTSGYYQENQILISNKFVNHHNLCHELIHFLVMADSSKLNWCPSQVPFINEGYTEFLASEIDNISPQSYIKNVDMVKFLNLFSKTKNENIKAFLKDEFILGDAHMWSNIHNMSKNYFYNKDTMSYRNIQRQIICGLIDKNNIKSIDDYIQIVDKLKQTPTLDKEYMENNYFKDLNRKFLENMKLPISEKTMKLLNQYCSASYKAENFGDKEVMEFDFGDISGSFDAEGQVYGDFPDGVVTFSPNSYMELNHNEQKQHYSLENFKGVNWVNEYNKVKESLYTFFNYKEKDQLISK